MKESERKEILTDLLKNHWGKIIIGILSLIVALIGIPVMFNFAFMWDSGHAKGQTSDWFVFYGNIFGGLIGGFFTYLAVVLTFRNEKKKKEEEMRPNLDIPNKSYEFIDDNNYNGSIAIDINNIGGSIAKNLECQLTLTNYDEVIDALKKIESDLKMKIITTKTSMVVCEKEEQDKVEIEQKTFMMVVNEDGKETPIGGVQNEYPSMFIGSCIPIHFNHEANAKFIIHPHVSRWINYIIKNRSIKDVQENEIFEFDLRMKYSSIEYGNYTDYFNLKWRFVGAIADKNLRYQYVLECTKLKSEIGA